MTTLLIIFAACTFALLVWVLWKMAELDELQDELDKYSVHLDERANRLAADENSLLSLQREFYADRDKGLYTASYTVTESDLMKYTTDRAVEANAKNHIAMTIAHDIIKRFIPHENTTEDGRRKFTYRFKIVEQ